MKWMKWNASVVRPVDLLHCHFDKTSHAEMLTLYKEMPGWNDSLSTFHLISVTHSDPMAGGKTPKNVLECGYYFFYMNRFTSLS